jgi:nucleoside phosphorylase
VGVVLQRAKTQGRKGPKSPSGATDQPLIDIGILTIRDDEFRAVLDAYPGGHGIHRGRHREYTLRTTDAGEGKRYRVAILRQIEQGNGEAQEAARDLIDDLQPSLLLVVGIAGGLPSDDISLGDVVLSTRVHDFSLEARKFEEATTYNVGGGPIAKSIAAGVANLGARESELGDWWSELPSKPSVSLAPSRLYGPPKWQREVRNKLQAHYGKGVEERPPTFAAGPIASSDRLVKDPKLLFPWITSARGILAIEMESAGVHRATRERVPMLSIRGLSDIVGLKRQEAWTKYACASAAAFTRAYLRTRPVPLREPPKQQVDGPVSSVDQIAPEKGEHRATRIEESFANLIPLRHFPDTLYVAPALCKTRKHGWFLLNKRAPRKNRDYVPSAWNIYESNLYSLVDPEQSRLKSIIDVGGLEQFDARDWAFSVEDAKRRLFVNLLNFALREDLWSQGVRYYPDQDVYAFMGRPEEPPRQLKYANVKVRSTATVVAHYEHEAKSGKSYTYLRHNAFQGRFRLFEAVWYLEITPTYRFTRNGKDLDRYHEDRLSGIKRLERNRSVLSQLLQWQAQLRSPWTRVDHQRLLEFGPLISFRFASDVDESSLTALDDPQSPRPSGKEAEE